MTERKDARSTEFGDQSGSESTEKVAPILETTVPSLGMKGGAQDAPALGMQAYRYFD